MTRNESDTLDRASAEDLRFAIRYCDQLNAEACRRLWLLVGALFLLLLAVLAAPRVINAARQCAFPVFAYTAPCFVHDTLTGEDL